MGVDRRAIAAATSGGIDPASPVCALSCARLPVEPQRQTPPEREGFATSEGAARRTLGEKCTETGQHGNSRGKFNENQREADGRITRSCPRGNATYCRGARSIRPLAGNRCRQHRSGKHGIRSHEEGMSAGGIRRRRPPRSRRGRRPICPFFSSHDCGSGLRALIFPFRKRSEDKPDDQQYECGHAQKPGNKIFTHVSSPRKNEKMRMAQ